MGITKVVPNDEEVTIGGEEIRLRGASDKIFLTYKPIQVLQYYGKSKGWNVVHDMRTNAQASGAADGNVFTLDVHDANKKLIFREKIFVANKVLGRLRGPLNILIKIYGPNKKWLQLVRETKKAIDDARDLRGAPERPIFKKADTYLNEHRSNEAHVLQQSMYFTNKSSSMLQQKTS